MEFVVLPRLALLLLTLLVASAHAGSSHYPAQGNAMSGPARAGLFIYAKDKERVASFYQSVLGMTRAHEAPGLIVLRSPDIQISVNAMPAEVSSRISIASPPVKRDNAAFKFFFTVPSLSAAENAARELGGEVLPEQWQGPGFIVRNAVDPEGNIFHIRESAP